MSLEVVRGTIKNVMAIRDLISELQNIGVRGTFYAGYPIIASADSSHTIEALLLSEEHGLVAFTFPDQSEPTASVKDIQDQIFYLIEGNLKKHESLRVGRNLAFTPVVVSFYSVEQSVPQSDNQYHFASPISLKTVLKNCPAMAIEFYRPLCAAIQRVTTIKPAKRRENVQKTDSKGATLKLIEKEIANLDQWQKKAAIEVPDGPQRVRGLAARCKSRLAPSFT